MADQYSFGLVSTAPSYLIHHQTCRLEHSKDENMSCAIIAVHVRNTRGKQPGMEGGQMEQGKYKLSMASNTRVGL
jgi:hypothetical protein